VQFAVRFSDEISLLAGNLQGIFPEFDGCRRAGRMIQLHYQ